MGANVLETTGDGATLSYGSIGTLTGGTLTGPGTLTGVYGGAVLAVGTMTLLGGIYDMTPNEVEIKQVDTTKLAAGAEESQPGTPDYGEVSAIIAYNSANMATVGSWITNKTVQFFKLTVDDFSSTDSAYPFLGWVKKWTPISGDLKKDETAKAKITLKISGTPLFTVGS